jgi:hypothetical protein
MAASLGALGNDRIDSIVCYRSDTVVLEPIDRRFLGQPEMEADHFGSQLDDHVAYFGAEGRESWRETEEGSTASSA